MLEDLANVLDRLLRRLLDGDVVPFLGAGVSTCAKPRTIDSEESDPYCPTVKALVRLLARSLLADIKSCGPEAEALRTLMFAQLSLADIIERAQDATELVDHLTEHSGNKLERWAEVHGAKRGWTETVKVLRIDRMADLEPQPAHVYLAYLAREGLVREVVTTNYDTCLELALERSLMPASRGDNEFPVKVTSCLTDYRGKKVLDRGGGPRRPILHLYKINGCASVYRDALRSGDRSKEADAAERIVLTERQLQSFRTEHWAEDLVRDRSRCRALLFCGFGSDEPQVRHTLLAVAREFTERGATTGPHCGWDIPNAPFMVTYEPDLSFNQYQVMRGYAHAHDAAHTDTLHAKISNVITGRDIDRFDGSTRQRLPADTFWRRIFQAVFLRLIDRASGPGGELRRWLRSQGVDAPAMIADKLRTWLGIPADPASERAADAGNRCPWFGRRSALLEQSCYASALLGATAKNASGQDVVGPLVLSLWLLSVQGLVDKWLNSWRTSRGQASGALEPGHPYFPVREDPLLVVLTLLVVALLVGDSCDNDALKGGAAATTSTAGVEITCGLGLRITSADRGAHRRVVYLVTDNYEGSPGPPEDLENDPTQVIVQIVIPERRQLDSEERLRHTSSDAVRAARLVRVTVSEWLRDGCLYNHAELVRRWAMNPAPPRRAAVEDLS